MNTNPLAGNDSPIALSRTGNQFTLVFHRPKGGLVPEQATLQFNDTLTGTWTTVPAWEASSTITTVGDYERITYNVTANLQGTPRRFWRVSYE